MQVALFARKPSAKMFSHDAAASTAQRIRSKAHPVRQNKKTIGLVHTAAAH